MIENQEIRNITRRTRIYQQKKNKKPRMPEESNPNEEAK